MKDFYVLDHIIKLLQERHITVYKLAKSSGITYSSLNSMLKGRHIPSINNLIKICNGFNMPLSQFFAEIENNLKENAGENDEI